jgi:2-keto-3-deoxy-L-rhamnonate aldolase RhmA
LNAAAKLRVDGVDALLFGPADLAADFDHLGRTEHPEAVAAIESAVARIPRDGKLVGMSTGEPSLPLAGSPTAAISSRLPGRAAALGARQTALAIPRH